MSIDQTFQQTGSNDGSNDPTTAYTRPQVPAGYVPQQQAMPGYAPSYGPPPAPPMPPLPAAPKSRRTGLIAAIIGIVVVLLGGGLAAFFVFANRTVDPDTVAKEIVRVTEQNEKATPTGIQCPSDVPFETGRVFTCTATLFAHPVTYTITQHDDKGAVTINYIRPVLDETKVAKAVVDTTKKQLGIEPQNVQCPSDVATKQGGAFTCTATLDGQAITYQLNQTDDKGGLTIEHDRVLLVKDVDEQLAAALTKEVGEQIVAACGKDGQTVIVNAPGAPISCGAANAANPDRNAHVTAKVDKDGNITYTLQ
jgi:hypothetical protein